MSDSILEVIACSVADAVEAEQGGAKRLEVISRFDVGGLTPPLDLVRRIKTQVALPLRVMLRESEGFGIPGGDAELEALCAAARQLNELGVDGVVLGFLRGEEIDLELTRSVLTGAPNLKATFHHAFEDAADKLAAIEHLKTLPQIDRILAHGGTEDWPEKYPRLEFYARAAAPSMKILAGGGVDAGAIRFLRRKTSITEFHTGSAARSGGKVDRSKVRELVRALGEDDD